MFWVFGIINLNQFITDWFGDLDYTMRHHQYLWLFIMKKFVLIGLLCTSLTAVASPQYATINYQYTTPLGLQYNIIKQGHGVKPTIGDEVEIRFVSYNSKGELLEGTLNQVPVILPIETAFYGLQQSLFMMPVGSIYEFYIPAKLGYQEEGKSYKQASTYRIELLRINP